MICNCVSITEVWGFKPLSDIQSRVDFLTVYPNWLASFFILFEQTYLIYLGHCCLVSLSLNLLFILVEYLYSKVSYYFKQSTQQLPQVGHIYITVLI